MYFDFLYIAETDLKGFFLLAHLWKFTCTGTNWWSLLIWSLYPKNRNRNRWQRKKKYQSSFFPATWKCDNFTDSLVQSIKRFCNVASTVRTQSNVKFELAYRSDLDRCAMAMRLQRWVLLSPIAFSLCCFLFLPIPAITIYTKLPT